VAAARVKMRGSEVRSSAYIATRVRYRRKEEIGGGFDNGFFLKGAASAAGGGRRRWSH
jgi:hypothetical protein